MRQSSNQTVRELVAQADRRRRAQAAAARLQRLAPLTAGIALVAGLMGRLLGGPAWLGVAALVVGAAGLGLYVYLERRTRPTTDTIASAVDADAHLAGELRSAHWFESAGAPDSWAAFHLDRATEHARAVDWTTLYPGTRSARAWVVTAVLAAGVVAAAIRMPARVTAEGDEAGLAAGEIGAALPVDLQRKLAALLAQMDQAIANKDPNAKEVTLAELKDLMAKLDPALQRKLTEMLEKRAADKNAKLADPKLGADERADRAENATSGLPEDVKWALENEAARMAQSSDDRKTAENNPAGKTGEMGMGSPQAQMETTAAPAASPLLREAASDPGGKLMMGGGGPMGGDSRPGAGGNQNDAKGAAEALLVAQALRKELVEANADALGENVDKEDLRRKTEQGKSALGFTRVAQPRTFEPSRATAPPPVPEARRPLLFNYFIRRR
jgi:hypothetical protein